LMKPVWLRLIKAGISRCSLPVSTFARILRLQFCKHIGRNASTALLQAFLAVVSCKIYWCARAELILGGKAVMKFMICPFTMAQAAL
jgi:hypothetical protein